MTVWSHRILPLIGASIATAAFVLPGAAQAAPVALTGDGAWFDFSVLDGGTSWVDLASEPLSFTFTSASPIVLRVTDYFFPGDSTFVYANGSLLGETPVVPFSDTSFSDTAAAAYGSNEFGWSAWNLDAGSYVFTGLPGTLPLGAATLAISVEVVGAVPEPSSVAMSVLGLGILGTALKTRRRRG